MAEVQRVEIGFEGGQVISARIAEADLEDLRNRLEKGGWHDLHTEDGLVSLYLAVLAGTDPVLDASEEEQRQPDAVVGLGRLLLVEGGLEGVARRSPLRGLQETQSF